MTRISKILLCILLIPFAATAQKTITVPLAGKVVLRDIPDRWNAHVQSLEAPEPDGETGRAEFQAMKAETERRFPHRRSTTAAKATAALMPAIVKAFVPDSNSGIPPDNYVAVNNDTAGIS